MRVAIVGATGLVGSTLLRVLAERRFPVTELLPVASDRSAGRMISFGGTDWPVLSCEAAIALNPQLALFSAGGGVSKEWAPQFAAAGCRVIDNSSTWRMDADKKLIVPEVNGNLLSPQDFIIANPNCSTIQLVLVLQPLHAAYGIRRVVVSTYQSVTGTGQKAVDQLWRERFAHARPPAQAAPNAPPPPEAPATASPYPHPIDLNLIPHIDVFGPNGYTKEEMKLVHETAKIMGDPRIRITATCVRVPVLGGHSESVNIELERDYDLDAVKALLAAAPGVLVQDNPATSHYPTPLLAAGKNEVFAGRLRRDESQPNTLNCWIVADNLRKGAATNAVQIAELAAPWC